jgi:hypothetical protein
MDFPFGDQITVVARTAAGRDGDGNTTYTTVNTVVRGQFVPAGSVELVQGLDVVTNQPTVYLPAGTVVKATDQVVAAGVTFEVDGAPNAPVNGFTGWAPGVVVRLRNVTG